MMSEMFEPKNEFQTGDSSAKTVKAVAGSTKPVKTEADDTALEDSSIRYIEGLLDSKRTPGPIDYKPDSYVRQYDSHINSKYKPFKVFKQIAVMHLYHHWPKVAGAVLSKQTKLLEIQPPIIKVAAMTSPCLQQLQMMKRQLLKKINDFYGSELITDLECTMYQQSYLKAIQPAGGEMDSASSSLQKGDTSAYIGKAKHTDSYERVLINFKAIPLPADALAQIEASLATIHNEELRNELRDVQIKQYKKTIYLKEHGYHTCERCENLVKKEEILCSSCKLKEQEHKAFLYRQHINRIKDILMKEPFAVYEEVRQYVPQCSMEDYQLAHRECIYFFRNRVVREESNENYDIYMLLMLITHKKSDQLKPEFIRNSVLKMRAQYEKAKQAYNLQKN